MVSGADELRKQLDRLDKSVSSSRTWFPNLQLGKSWKMFVIPLCVLLILLCIRPQCILYVTDDGKMALGYKKLFIYTLVLSPIVYGVMWYKRML